MVPSWSSEEDHTSFLEKCIDEFFELVLRQRSIGVVVLWYRRTREEGMLTR